jgi:plastocyanin domain-containing protein
LAKTRISITIENGMAKSIEHYYREKVKLAAERGDPIPKLSNIYEEIIEKGWESKTLIKKK